MSADRLTAKKEKCFDFYVNSVAFVFYGENIMSQSAQRQRGKTMRFTCGEYEIKSGKEYGLITSNIMRCARAAFWKDCVIVLWNTGGQNETG